MKNLFLTFIISFAINKELQCQRPLANTHIANNFVDKFQGTWKWVSGTDTVILRLGKVEYFYAKPPNSSFDALVGCHSFINNGGIVESSMNRYDSVILYNHRRNTFFGWNIDSDTSKIQGTFTDLSKHKIGTVFLEYIGGTTPQIIWKLENTKGLVATPAGQPYDYGFTLPRDMILTKQ